MAERRPRRGDFDDNARFYTALIVWLDRRYPGDIAGRARKFRKLAEQEENTMPRLREAAATVETPAQRLARFATEDMLEHALYRPAREARARMVELIELDRDLEPDEQAEFDKYVARRDKRRQRSRRLSAAVDARQLKHPDETRGESALAVILRQSEKRRQRDARRDEREAAIQRVAAQERAEAAALAATEAASAPATARVPPPEAALMGEREATAPPRRPRKRAGIAFQTDAAGNRVD